ncbi:hypothetical protein ACFFV7_33640 [Nonomuraea spiralis]|uniref:DUF1109 domain-containing protein n=1 Tax=Nonomuraea spiralis TaxID=46182 RepID=A0ABV5IQ32_9ACTN|nr:hypothetical protein [Nonomuraea spiralis]
MDTTSDLPDASRQRAPTNVGGGDWATFAVLLGLGTIYATSVPGWHFMWLMLVGVGWLLFGVTWLIVLGVALVRRARLVALRRNWMFWAVPPLVVALVGSLVYVGAPFRMRFELSRSSLDHFAKTVSEGTPPGKRNWIGLYPVEYLEGSRRAFGFMIEDTGFFGSYGFAWSPNGEPDIDAPGYYRHFDGQWYLWIDD